VSAKIDLLAGGFGAYIWANFSSFLGLCEVEESS